MCWGVGPPGLGGTSSGIAPGDSAGRANGEPAPGDDPGAGGAPTPARRFGGAKGPGGGAGLPGMSRSIAPPKSMGPGGAEGMSFFFGSAIGGRATGIAAAGGGLARGGGA